MIKLHKNITDIATFQLHAKGMRCKKKCAECNRPWGETGTKFVTQKEEYVVRRQGCALVSNTYICEECTQKIENPQDIS